MKRLLVSLFLVLSLLIPSLSIAAVGSATITLNTFHFWGKIERRILTVSWTGGTGANAGTVPNTTIDSGTYGIGGWYLYSVETNPGSTAPSDNYDLVINDADGVDIVGGLLANRDQSTTELVNIGTSAYGYPVIRSNLTVVWSGNTVESSTGTIIMTFVPY